MKIRIGAKEYNSKKEAIEHYRSILNSYNFGESLNDIDYDDILDLLNYGGWFGNDLSEDYDDNVVQELENEYAIIQKPIKIADDADLSEFYQEIFNDKLVEKLIMPKPIYCKPEDIENIKVVEVQYSTKSFRIFYKDKSSHTMSYLMILNRKGLSSEQRFSKACRSAIQNDIKSLKQRYFDENSVKGQVKCQETEILSKWEELAVDHRQPNTFSVIVDRFKEMENINMAEIKYETDDKNNIVFKDNTLSEKFREYHAAKANLRIVRKECNLSRTGMARIKRTQKDLTI